MHARVVVGIAYLLVASPLVLAQNSPTPASAPPAPVAQNSSASPSALDPLPNIQTLLARVRARYDALENLRKSYIFTITQVADDFSSDGSKKTHTDQYQAFFVQNTEVRQHIARDGKPLSPGDAKKEQDRVDKLVARLKAHKQKDKDGVTLSASGLLKVATFSHPRREQINGRPAIVFDYIGDPHAPAANLSEQVMRQLAGTLWIDERDSAILRLNGSLQENFHVAGGLLVNIKKGSWFDFAQAPVNGEIWFPQHFTVHVDGRFLLVKGFDGDAHDSFSDYRKLKTTVTLLPGSRVVDETGQPLAEPSPPASADSPANGAQPRP